MTNAALEHINISVTDAQATARHLMDLFDWKIRWEGSSMDGEGYTVHVGSEDHYLAIYSPTSGVKSSNHTSYGQKGGLNHVGLVVDDIDAVESRVKAAGYIPKSHADYEPGKRFYFDNEDGIEFEIVSYS